MALQANAKKRHVVANFLSYFVFTWLIWGAVSLLLSRVIAGTSTIVFLEPLGAFIWYGFYFLWFTFICFSFTNLSENFLLFRKNLNLWVAGILVFISFIIIGFVFWQVPSLLTQERLTFSTELIFMLLKEQFWELFIE